jgi:GNAT superfamily N-acetyltransferase
MFEPEIRRGTEADLAQLTWLEQEARRSLIEQRGGPRWLATHASADWPEHLAGQHVIVACLDEVILGYLVAAMGSEGVATIEQVYVDPGARGIGCGDGMMEAAITWAKNAGCAYLEGEALPGDRETKNLYERSGITARMITVSVRL